jgi:hypothetical protein
MAKALCWAVTDTERRKLEEQQGLDSPTKLIKKNGQGCLFWFGNQNVYPAISGNFRNRESRGKCND